MAAKVDRDRNPEEQEMIDWDSPNWGKPGHNVHLAANGSWSSESEKKDD